MGRGRKRRSRRKSASTFRAVRSRAPPPASATARCCASRSRTTAKARSIAGASSRWSITPRPACSESSAALPGGGGRLIPVDKKQAGRELNIAKADSRRRRGRRSRQRRSGALARLRPGLRQGQGAARLAGVGESGQPDRDPCPRNSAGVLAGRVARSRSSQARDAEGPRGLARRCRWSPSIRPTPRITTTRFMPSRIPIRTTRAASSSRSRSPTSRSMCGRARRSTATR